jgi:hypothetical protein
MTVPFGLPENWTKIQTGSPLITPEGKRSDIGESGWRRDICVLSECAEWRDQLARPQCATGLVDIGVRRIHNIGVPFVVPLRL